MSKVVPTATYIIPTHPLTHRSSEQKIVVNRYSDPNPTPGRAKIAVILAHANGYHKEIWNPVLRRVRDIFRDGDAYELEFWSLDCRNQGDSAVVNEKVLDEYFSWTDYGLDTLQIIDHFELKRSAAHIVGVGHSLGSCALVIAEQKRPGTFAALIANDPVLPSPTMKMAEGLEKKFPLAIASLKRRDRWPTRELARESFFKNQFYQIWDPEMVDIYVNNGLRLVPDSETGKEVTLKCLKAQEYATFTYDQKSFYDAFINLPNVQAPVHFVLGEKSQVVSFEHGALLASRPPRGSATFVKGAGHLVVMEKPEAVAREIERVIHNQVVLPALSLQNTPARL